MGSIVQASAPLWTFTELVSADRREKLLAVPSFDAVMARIADGTIDYFEAENRKNPRGLGCVRAFFRFLVQDSDYDAFFNSPSGYRAQYCISVERGRTQNHRLIEALTGPSHVFLERRNPEEELQELVRMSLEGVDAKVWIRDADLENLVGPHIDYAPWVEKTRAATTGSWTDQAARGNATSGVLAPVNTHVELKGGWITPQRDEWRDPTKARRAEEIRDYGYT